MVGACLTFGKFRGQPLSALPRSYLSWLVQSCDSLDAWTRGAAKDELRRRGQRFLDAAAVLRDLEEEVTARVCEDGRLEHEAAGVLTDHLMDAFEEVRRRHGIGEQTELAIPARRPPLCPACRGRIWGAAR